ncbi:MAG: ATP-binding protein, partial [Acidimicrobiales bacterium]
MASEGELREVTFLFSDLESSTRLLREVGAGYPAVLTQHWDLVRAAATRHDGAEFGAEGDAMFFTFLEPGDAVAAAVDIQLAHTNASWPEPIEVRVRVAVHTGEAVPALGTWLGVAVHQTARICAAGHGGQILASASVVDRVGTPLDHDGQAVSLESLGEFDLRDIPGPQRLFQAVHPALESTFPGLRTKTAARTNLPNQRTTFVGRLAERDEVASLVAPGSVVTIAGPGGAGKTRLALEVAGAVGPHYGDGSWLIELAALSRGDDVDALVASTLHAIGIVPGSIEVGELRDGVLRALADHHLLLLLDNCEHVVDGVAEFVDALLAAAPGIAVVATSREPLAVPGETVWRIPPLSATSGAQLFLDRVGREQPMAPLPASDEVTALCERLDGLPLAVELAASRAATMGLAELSRNLAERLPALSGGPRTADPRQRSLRALIEWSYELLSVEEQAMLRWAAVLPSSFSLDIAHAVAPAIDVFGAVDGLVRKSLGIADVGDGGPGRYRLFETVRAFGVEQLERAGETDAVHARLGEGLLSHLKEVIPKLAGPDQGALLAGVVDDLPSYRAAMEWALEADPSTAVGLASRLGQILGTRGSIVEGRLWVERALAVGHDAPPGELVQALAAAGTLSR